MLWLGLQGRPSERTDSLSASVDLDGNRVSFGSNFLLEIAKPLQKRMEMSGLL